MKKIRLTILMLSLVVGVLRGATTQAVVQEIRFACKGANEVFIVWGVDRWQLLPEDEIPEGSYFKNKMTYTPMVRKEDGVFSAAIKVKQGTTIDYCFWITNGPLQKSTDIWDNNGGSGKDYHTVAVSNAVTMVESKVKVRPNETLSILDYAYILFVTSLTVCTLLYLFKKLRFNLPLKKRPGLVIVCSAISLLFFLFMIRPSVLGISWDIITDPVKFIPQMVWAVFYDAAYVVGLTSVFLLLIFILRKYSLAQLVLSCLFLALCCFSLIISVLNIKIVEIIGKPFNYQWLYYSDFLKSVDSKAALSANISFSEIARIISLCAFAFLVSLAVLKVALLLLQNPARRRISLASLLFVTVVYGVIARSKLNTLHWNYDRLANPVTAFAESVNPFAANPALFTMNVPDSLKYETTRIKKPAVFPYNSSHIKNVIIFVLESTPAEYIEIYGGKYKVSPQIKKYAQQAVTFENIYAHAPATNMSMVSMLGSIYPQLSYNSFTAEHPDMKIPTISAELKQKEFRTAFFNSADNRFQKASEFLANRKFDKIMDCRDDNCMQNKFEIKVADYDYLDGKDDACSGQDLSEWINKDTTKPFFAMLWTFQTHYPYLFRGEESSYEPADVFLNRYLNAVHYGDSVLGNVLETLKKNHLFESTLVVVIGDHGEAFGRHEQITHARKIYEENLHVPCIFINPAFKGERRSEIGGVIDVAPTIMNILGFESPVEWQGENLFAKNEYSRAFFFAPWSDYLFGYREGNKKYIFNATKNETEIYDLKNDPQEKNNLVAQKQNEVQLCHQRLAAWAQYVNRTTDKILEK